MSSQSLETHYQSALALYRQRCTILTGCNITPARVLLVLEKRLRVHLYILSYVLDDNENADGAAETFIYIARRLINADKAIHRELKRQLQRWVLEPEHERTAGIQDALELFEFPDFFSSLMILFKSASVTRRLIISLWCRSNTSVPPAVIKQLFTHSDRQLNLAALDYYQVFSEQNYHQYSRFYEYDKYLHSDEENVREVVLRSLWIGLVKQDPNASIAVTSLLEILDGSDDYFTLLHLLALCGDFQYYPVLLEACENDPQQYYPLLGLYAGGHIVNDLLSALARPQSAESAAVAWEMLTGQTLPLVTSMNTGTAENDNADNTSEPEDGVEQYLPDVDQANSWWKENNSKWEDHCRYRFGNVMTLSDLIDESKTSTGTTRSELYDLAAAIQADLLTLPRYGWLDKQIEILNSVNVNQAPVFVKSYEVENAGT